MDTSFTNLAQLKSPWFIERLRIKSRNGSFEEDVYASGMHRSTSVLFEGSFDIAMEFLSLHGVRRAIIAYWTEALIDRQEKEGGSLFARHHNWNAVAELKRRILSNTL